MKAIGLTGCDGANQALVAAQLLDRFTTRGLQISVCIGVVTREDAYVIAHGGGELWRVGHDPARPELDPLIIRWVDTYGELDDLIARVDERLAEFLGKQQLGMATA
jgi:hypothetical protein